MRICNFVTGQTALFGILGCPVDHSFSPVLQTTLLQESGLNGVYVPFKVEPGDIRQAVEGAYALNVQGLNVTVPHKTAVMACLKEVDSAAEKIGAVNTLKRTEGGYIGYNTDIIGLKKTLEMKGVSVKDKRYLVIGAGGAANAAVVLGALEGAGEILIVNRTMEKAQRLKEQTAKFYDGRITVLNYEQLAMIDRADIIIQTTSLGMSSDQSPIEDTRILEGAEIAVDIIYTPLTTRFLKQAKTAGCLTANGFDMLVYQGIAAFELWHDKKFSDGEIQQLRTLFLDYYTG